MPWLIVAVIKKRQFGGDPKWLESMAQRQPWSMELSVMAPLLRCSFWKSDPCRGPRGCSPPASSVKASILTASAPQYDYRRPAAALLEKAVAIVRNRLLARCYSEWGHRSVEHGL